MSFKRLAIRTKKSLSGLYPSSSDTISPANDGTSPCTPTKDSPTRPCDEFGMQSTAGSHLARDSPSRRKRFLGSLRSMGSLRSIRSSHPSAKPSNDCSEKPEPDNPHTPVRDMPSLALNFEASPADKPMFMMRKTSSSSSMAVHRSSPISVPTSAKQGSLLFNTPPEPSDFTVGTMPETFAPLQKAVAREATLRRHTDAVDHIHSPQSMNKAMEPLPTPMPGTHLPLEDIAGPEIVVSSPSSVIMHTDMTRIDPEDDYFSVTVPSGRARERESSLVTTQKLDPTTDAEIVALLALGTHGVPQQSFETCIGELSPLLSAETTPRHSEEAAPSRPRDESLSDNGEIGRNLAYVVWDDPAIADQDKHQYDQGSQHDDVAQQEGSNSSPADHTEADTNTELTVPDQERSHTMVVDDAAQVLRMPEARSVPVSADDRETLQDIIRAYAGSMAYHEEAEAHHAAAQSCDFPETQAVPLEEVTNVNAKAEVEYFSRVINRSLGG